MTTGPHDRGGKREKRQPSGLSAKRKRLKFVSVKERMKPASGLQATIERKEHWFELYAY